MATKYTLTIPKFIGGSEPLSQEIIDFEWGDYKIRRPRTWVKRTGQPIEDVVIRPDPESKNVSIKRKGDKYSSAFLNMWVGGTHFAEVTITEKAGSSGTPITTTIHELKNVYISNVGTDTRAPGDVPTLEWISLSFDTIKTRYID